MGVTDQDERAKKGYDDKKEFTCVCCGKKVMLTKFASAKTAKCPECKESGKSVNPDLVPTSTSSKKAPQQSSGNTKTLPCTKCGTMMEVSKFMSAAKVLCDNCKDTGDNYVPTNKLKIDTSKVDMDTMPSLSEYTVLPSNIANRNLRDVTCPACGTNHMRIVNILDYSSFGLIVHYQCNHCKLLVSVSEQCYFRCPTHKPGEIFDYSGHKIEDMINSIANTRIHGSIRKLYDIIKEHNIEIDGIELPPYKYEEERPVPVGFTIPKGDKDVKVVEDTIKLLKDLQEGMGYHTENGEPHERYNDVCRLIPELEKLFTVEGNGD